MELTVIGFWMPPWNVMDIWYCETVINCELVWLNVGIFKGCCWIIFKWSLWTDSLPITDFRLSVLKKMLTLQVPVFSWLCAQTLFVNKITFVPWIVLIWQWNNCYHCQQQLMLTNVAHYFLQCDHFGQDLQVQQLGFPNINLLSSRSRALSGLFFYASFLENYLGLVCWRICWNV